MVRNGEVILQPRFWSSVFTERLIEPSPFDNIDQRVIYYDLHAVGRFDEARQEFEEQVGAIQADASLTDNPISRALRTQALKTSTVTTEQTMGEILSALVDLRRAVDKAVLTREQRVGARLARGDAYHILTGGATPLPIHRASPALIDAIVRGTVRCEQCGLPVNTGNVQLTETGTSHRTCPPEEHSLKAE